MEHEKTPKPRIAVLHEKGGGRPPGLEPLENEAQLLWCHDLPTLRAALAEAEVLLVADFRRPLLRDAWSVQEELQWIHTTSAGVDTVLTPPVRQSGIPVTNARGIFEDAIAEYVLGMILVFAKDSLTTAKLQTQHRWLHRETETIGGKKVLIVGAGAVGSRVGRQLKQNGMDVRGISRRERPQDTVFGRVHSVGELSQWLSEMDYVVITAPLTEQTRGMFGPKEFQSMKKTGRIVNVGRGAIIQTDALVEALQRREIAGAALDTFETEPLPSDHPLWEMPNVIITAHMAGDFIGWREAVSAQFLDNFRRWRRGEALFNRVQ